jgi:CubicO group peptidase (beta-lactamase class C family)
VQEGLIELDDPVGKHIPELANLEVSVVILVAMLGLLNEKLRGIMPIMLYMFLCRLSGVSLPDPGGMTRSLPGRCRRSDTF